MAEFDNPADLAALFINDVPLLDVRAPVEFARGAFPAATNLPLLDDQERAAVGKMYKSSGQQAAIALGNELISGAHKTGRIALWKHYLEQNPRAQLYCYRGGLRSKTVQQWLAQEGIAIPRITGGYKRMRRELLNTIETVSAGTDLLIIAGKTGSGKTHLINTLQHSIDLEGLAQHRGSAFGTRVESQPSQINFENTLAISLLKLPKSYPHRLFLEDESRAIGSLSLPQRLYGKMLEAPIALLEESLEQRVATIFHDYIHSNYLEFRQADPHNYQQLFADYLLTSLAKIRRRLGEESYGMLRNLMETALAATRPDLDAHREWIQLLLSRYYDPMYEYQLGKKAARVVFRGNRDELLRWAAHLNKPLHEAHARAS